MAPAAGGRAPRRAAGESASERTRENRRLLVRYQRHRDLAARDRLVERLLPLARQLARRYQRGSEPVDDLVQVASIGLLKAINRYDLDRGTSITSYAVPVILGELKRHFRDTGWAAHVPRGMQESALEVERTVERLSRSMGRSPSLSDIAEAMGVTVEQVLDGMEASMAYEAVSLDRRAGSEEGMAVADTLGAEDERLEMVEDAVSLVPALRVLSPRDRQVLTLRFAEDMTQSEIAARIGVSQMHVSRLLRSALARLRAAAE